MRITVDKVFDQEQQYQPTTFLGGSLGRLFFSRGYCFTRLSLNWTKSEYRFRAVIEAPCQRNGQNLLQVTDLTAHLVTNLAAVDGAAIAYIASIAYAYSQRMAHLYI